MVLGADILNSDASLNSYFKIASLDFVPGGPADLVLQLKDLQKNLRFVPPVDAVLKITLNQLDGSTVEKTAVILDSGDRSLWKLELDGSDTEELLSGNFRFTLDLNGDESVLIQGLVQNGLRSLLMGC